MRVSFPVPLLLHQSRGLVSGAQAEPQPPASCAPSPATPRCCCRHSPVKPPLSQKTPLCACQLPAQPPGLVENEHRFEQLTGVPTCPMLFPNQAWGWQGAKGARVAAGCTRMSQPSPNLPPSAVSELAGRDLAAWKMPFTASFRAAELPWGLLQPQAGRLVLHLQRNTSPSSSPCIPAQGGSASTGFATRAPSSPPSAAPALLCPFREGQAEEEQLTPRDVLHRCPRTRQTCRQASSGTCE